MKTFSACLLGCTLTLSASPALAVVDQQYVPATTNEISNVGVGNVVDWAQTFTVGITGTLTGVDIWVDRQAEVAQPLLLDIRTTVAGAPSEPDVGSNILASLSLPASMFLVDPDSIGAPPSELSHVELASQAFFVVAGQVLAIALRSDDPGAPSTLTYGWHGNDPGAYAGGSAYLRVSGEWEPQEVDQVFRTYVTPIPEPAAAVLSVVALSSIAVMRRRTGIEYRFSPRESRR